MSSSDPNSFAASVPTRGGVISGKTLLDFGSALVDHLYSGSSWSAYGTAATVTYGYRTSGTPGNGASGFQSFNAAQIAATEKALQAWADVANITFQRVQEAGGYSNNATILFGDYNAGDLSAAGFAGYPGSRSVTSSSGDVWINGTLSYNTNPLSNNYGAQVLVHEIGHAVGLSHPSDYDGTASYSVNAEYYEDSRQYTVMSYFSEQNTGGDFGNYYSAAPLLDDIYAIQKIYGANGATRTGDTVYGFNSNAGRDWFGVSSSLSPSIFAVWDAGGNDTFDFSGYSQGGTIDLRQGAFSSVGGLKGNVAIAIGTTIERAIGGSGAETIIGNAADNALYGGAGNDRLYGEAGNDSLYGGSGDDILDGGSGTNFIDGGDGTDTLLLAGTTMDYEAFANADGSWTITAPNISDRVINIERVSLGAVTAGATLTTMSFADFQTAAFPALRYVASYSDLIVAIGASTSAARQHYDLFGRAEGRTATFDALEYGASNIDLARAFGADINALARHYILAGYAEHRVIASFNALEYGASNIDLAKAIGANASALEQHYITNGIAENRGTMSFDALRYAASNPDVYRSLGLDATALTVHYLTYGAREGRSTTSFDPWLYAASNVDVARATGGDRSAIEQHYLVNGIAERRATASFNVYGYAVANPDVARATNYDRTLLAQHYIFNGIAEGRIVGSFDPWLYGASNVDLARAFGADPVALTRHYVTSGAAEGRTVARFDALEYAASNVDVAKAFGTNVDLLAAHYITSGLAEGRQTTSFDALRYAASNADLLQAYGTDTSGLVRHYITAGIAEGRTTTGFDPLRYLASNIDLIGKVALDPIAIETQYISSGYAQGRATASFDAVAYMLTHPEARGTNGTASALNYYIGGGYRATTSLYGLFGTEQSQHSLAPGQTISSTFATPGDRDWYEVTFLKPVNTLNLTLMGSTTSFDTVLSYYDSNGVLLGTFDNVSSTLLYASFATPLPAGTYYVVAATKNDALSGAYTLQFNGSSSSLGEPDPDGVSGDPALDSGPAQIGAAGVAIDHAVVTDHTLDIGAIFATDQTDGSPGYLMPAKLEDMIHLAYDLV